MQSRKPPEAASNPAPETPPIFSESPAAMLPYRAPRRRRGSGLAHGRPRAAGPTTRTRTARLAAHNEPSTGVSGRTPPHSPRRHATQAAQRRIINQRRNQQDIPPEGHESPAEARPGRPARRPNPHRTTAKDYSATLHEPRQQRLPIYWPTGPALFSVCFVFVFVRVFVCMSVRMFVRCRMHA